ncbi:hypothetical protein AB0D04_41705 [Streptomyces sp. NPDC048483]|uniref:hypothetical protein n=1 Tax=Streptomyces sp. NPDC048483 TaxID=3154927 RepID=UPI003413AE27
MEELALKAEADMRLYSDRMAAELARKRRERPATDRDGARRSPAQADEARPAGAAGAADEESQGRSTGWGGTGPGRGPAVAGGVEAPAGAGRLWGRHTFG